MELNIKIFTNNSCKLVIEDKTEYLKESLNGVFKDNFKYSDTTSIINVLQRKTKETISNSIVFNHKDSKFIEVPINFDGWFTIDYIVLPNAEWFERELAKTSGSALSLYKIIYYCDNGTIYKYTDGVKTTVSLDELLLFNPVNVPVFKIQKDYVSICFLKKCYINLCLLIFNQRGFSPCWNKSTVDSELVYKRDLVWMAINVIKYLTKMHSEDCNPTLSEVQRIIETISGCNGLCPSSNVVKNTSGCGCAN